MNTLIIPFHNYNSTDPIGQILLTYLYKNIHKFPVDAVFVVGGDGFGFDDSTEQLADGKILRKLSDKHGNWQSNVYSAVSSLSNSNDKFVLIDSDLMVYDHSLFSDLFLDLDHYDIITHFDSATTIMPTWGSIDDVNYEENAYRNLPYKIEVMKPNQYRHGRTRFTHWIYASRKQLFLDNFIKEIDIQYDIESTQQLQPMEALTRNIAELYPNIKVKELVDIRSNVYIDIDKKSSIIPSSITGDKRDFAETVLKSKYYHVRNFGEVASRIDYIAKMSVEHIKIAHWAPWSDRNYSEMVRLISWNMTILEKLGILEQYKDRLNTIFVKTEQPDLNSIEFQEYYKLFQQFHRTHLL